MEKTDLGAYGMGTRRIPRTGRCPLMARCSRAGFLLLLLVQREKRDAADLDNFESNTGDITDGLSLSAESRNENLILATLSAR